MSTKSLRRPYDYRTTALRFVSERIVTPYGHRTGFVRYPLIPRLNGDGSYYRWAPNNLLKSGEKENHKLNRGGLLGECIGVTNNA